MPVYGQGRNQTALAALHPSLHGLRHTFAVSTILDAYGDGGDVEERLAALSTYLGHVDPAKTYWYLSAAPELMEQRPAASSATSVIAHERPRPNARGVRRRVLIEPPVSSMIGLPVDP